jgi:hypothetical protein
MATSNDAELLALSVLRSPYESWALFRKARSRTCCSLTVIPSPISSSLENLSQNFLVIVKDGLIYKKAVA